MSRKYVLNADKTVSLMDDLVEWSRRFEETDRRIERTVMPDGKIVSTVFLGVDHNFSEVGPPLIFETMVFPSEKDFHEEWVDRCSTYQQALQQHQRGIAEAKRLSEGVSEEDTPTSR